MYYFRAQFLIEIWKHYLTLVLLYVVNESHTPDCNPASQDSEATAIN